MKVTNLIGIDDKVGAKTKQNNQPTRDFGKYVFCSSTRSFIVVLQACGMHCFETVHFWNWWKKIMWGYTWFHTVCCPSWKWRPLISTRIQLNSWICRTPLCSVVLWSLGFKILDPLKQLGRKSQFIDYYTKLGAGIVAASCHYSCYSLYIILKQNTLITME